jgi:hypothetical protein
LLLRGRELQGKEKASRWASGSWTNNRNISRVWGIRADHHRRGGPLGIWGSRRPHKLSRDDKLLTRALLALVLECFTDLARYPRCVLLQMMQELRAGGSSRRCTAECNPGVGMPSDAATSEIFHGHLPTKADKRLLCDVCKSAHTGLKW